MCGAWSARQVLDGLTSLYHIMTGIVEGIVNAPADTRGRASIPAGGRVKCGGGKEQEVRLHALHGNLPFC
jgi:hypothetical protein